MNIFQVITEFRDEVQKEKFQNCLKEHGEYKVVFGGTYFVKTSLSFNKFRDIIADVFQRESHYLVQHYDDLAEKQMFVPADIVNWLIN